MSEQEKLAAHMKKMRAAKARKARERKLNGTGGDIGTGERQVFPLALFQDSTKRKQRGRPKRPNANDPRIQLAYELLRIVGKLLGD